MTCNFSLEYVDQSPSVQSLVTGHSRKLSRKHLTTLIKISCYDDTMQLDAFLTLSLVLTKHNIDQIIEKPDLLSVFVNLISHNLR